MEVSRSDKSIRMSLSISILSNVTNVLQSMSMMFCDDGRHAHTTHRRVTAADVPGVLKDRSNRV